MSRGGRAALAAVAASALAGASVLLPLEGVAAGPTVAELVEVADIEAFSASPDGRLVAFRVQRASIELNSHVIEWHVADLAAGTVRRVAEGAPIYNDGIIEAEPPVWSPDSRFIHHRALVDGRMGIWRTAADGSGSRAVVVGDADVESIAPGADASELIYFTGPTRDEIARAERREYDEGILIDESVELGQSLYRGGYVQGRLASQRLVGRWYQRGGLLWRAPRQRHRLDLMTLAQRIAEPVPAPEVEPLSPAEIRPLLSATSASGDVASVAGSGAAQRLEVRLRAGMPIACAAATCASGRIVALAWRPGHDEILFTRQDEHFRHSLYRFAPRTGAVREVAVADGLLSGGRRASLPCAVTAAAAVCVAAGAASPPRVEAIDIVTGRRSILFDPNAALRAGSSYRVEQLEWRLEDGRRATGTLLLPPGTDPSNAPLFLTYYQCPGYLRGGVGDEFPLGPLVDSGFIVACMNMVPFEQWGDGVDRYRAALASVRALVELLASRGLVDPSRVGMAGFSAGSEATMWIAMNSSLLAAASVSSPQYEPSAYWFGAIRGRDNPQVLREFMQLGAPDEDPERWRLVAPALNVERISVPLLMQLPEQETRHAAELYARLGRTTTPVEMYAFPDEGHVKIQPRHRFAVYRRNLDWFRYWLQAYVDPAPEKAEQYRRWHALRRRRHGSAAE